MLLVIITLGVAIFLMMWSIRPAPAEQTGVNDPRCKKLQGQGQAYAMCVDASAGAGGPLEPEPRPAKAQQHEEMCAGPNGEVGWDDPRCPAHLLRAECEAQVTDLHDTPAERRANIAECMEQHRPKPRPVAFRPWQEVWQCNDLRVTVTSNAPGMVNYDIAGSIWGGINFTFDGPRHQLYKGAWPCALVQ